MTAIQTMLLETLPVPEVPWSLAGTAAGVAIIMVVLFLRAIAMMRTEHANEMVGQRTDHSKQVKEQREAHSTEMQAQRALFVTSLEKITATNAASAERVEVALRDLAMELRSGYSRPRGNGAAT